MVTGFVMVGSVKQVPKGEGRLLETHGREVAVFHLENGKFMVVDNHCPHQGGPLSDGILSGDVVTCPLHGLKVRLTDGKALREESDPDSAYKNVQTYPVIINNEKIFIGL